MNEGMQFNFVSILVKIYEFLTGSQFLVVFLYWFCPQNFERAATMKGQTQKWPYLKLMVSRKVVQLEHRIWVSLYGLTSS